MRAEASDMLAEVRRETITKEEHARILSEAQAASADEARQLVAQYEEAIREKVKETEERKKHEFTIAMVNVRRACRSRLGPP